MSFSMSFKVKVIPKFESELKRLVKKYPSLKFEFRDLKESLKSLRFRVSRSVTTALKYDCPLSQKERVSREEAGSLLVFSYLKKLYTFYPFSIKVKRTIFRIRN